jgi:hypothetical protein
VVVMDTEQILRMRLFWGVAPDSSTAQCVPYLTPDWIQGSSRPVTSPPGRAYPLHLPALCGALFTGSRWKPFVRRPLLRITLNSA